MSINVSWPFQGGTTYPIPTAGEDDWPTLTNYLVALAGAQGRTIQRIGTREATSTPVTVSSSSDCVILTNMLVASAVVVNLPSGIEGQYFCVVDKKGDAGTNNITINPFAGQTINGGASYVINNDKTGVTFLYSGTNWSAISEVSSVSGGIPLSDLQAIPSNTAVANISGITQVPSAIPTVADPTASTIMRRDGNANTAVNNIVRNLTSTATAAGTTTLSLSSSYVQRFTGTSTQTVVLPVAATLSVGFGFLIINDSTGNVTVQSSGLNTVQVILPGTASFIVCILASGTSAASWTFPSSISGVRGTFSSTLNAGNTTVGTLSASTGLFSSTLTAGAVNGSDFHQFNGTRVILDRGTGNGSIAYTMVSTAAGTNFVATESSTGGGIVTGAPANSLVLLSNTGAGIYFANNNTAPQGSLASGVWTLGAANSTEQHAINGTLRATRAGAANSIFRSSDNQSVLLIDAGTVPSIMMQKAGVNQWRFYNDTDNAMKFSYEPTSVINATVSALGAWTLGQSGTALNTVHTIRSNAITILDVNRNAAGSSRMTFSQNGTLQGALGYDATAGDTVNGTSANDVVLKNFISAGGISFGGGSGNNVLGRVSDNGGWTFGRSVTSETHTFSSTSGSGTALSISNFTGSPSTTRRGFDIVYAATSAITGGRFISCQRGDGTQVAYCDAVSDTSANWISASDKRLKEDFKTFDGLKLVMKMKAYDYQYKNSDVRQIGFVAQELYEVLPSAVSVGSDETTKEGGLSNPWGVSYGSLTPVLVKAVQELKAENDFLRKEIAEIKARLSKA